MLRLIVLAVLICLAFTVQLQAAEVQNLTLQECIQIAVSKHPEIIAAQADVNKEQGKVDVARSKIYPSILGSGSYNHIDPVLFAGFGPFIFPIDSASSFLAGISVHYSIYNGGRLINSVKASEFSLSSKSYVEQETILEKILGTKRAFYQAVLAKEELRAAKWSLNEAELDQSTAKQLYEIGAAPRLVFLNSHILETRAEQNFSDASASYQQELNTLSVAIGLQPGEMRGIRGNFIEPDLPSSDSLLKKIYESNPELKADEATIEKTRVKIKVAEAINDPDVSLFAGDYWFTRPFIPFISANQNQAGVQVTWPLEFGNQSGQVKEASSDLVSAQARLEQDKHNLALAMSVAYSDASRARDEILVYAQNAAEARKSFEDSIAAFSNGFITSSQLDETQNLENDSRKSYLTALYAYDEALARISFLLAETR